MSVARPLTPPAPRSPHHPTPLDVVVVSGEDSHLRVDKECLRKLGVHEPRIFTSGLDAAEWLAAHPAHVVLLDHRLADMSGLEFVRLLRMHPDLRESMPMVMASSGNTREHVVSALGAGCVGYLIRPYSIQSLAGHLERAMNGTMRALSASASALAFARGEEEPDEELFHSTLAQRREEHDRRSFEERHMARGKIFLQAGNYSKAVQNFAAVVEHNDLNSDARMGLAEAWRNLGHPEKFVECMHGAVLACLRCGDTEKAARATRRLQAKAPHASDPCVEIARTMVHANRFDLAARGFEASSMSRRTADGEVECALFDEMKRACHFSGHPHRAAAQLARELSKTGRFGRPRPLFARIMGPVCEPNRTPQKGVQPKAAPAHARRTRRPVLGDVWSVVKYTFKSYVKDGKDVDMKPLGPAMEPLEDGA